MFPSFLHWMRRGSFVVWTYIQSCTAALSKFARVDKRQKQRDLGFSTLLACLFRATSQLVESAQLNEVLEGSVADSLSAHWIHCSRVYAGLAATSSSHLAAGLVTRYLDYSMNPSVCLMRSTALLLGRSVHSISRLSASVHCDFLPLDRTR
jgi:hypothetical protein